MDSNFTIEIPRVAHIGHIMDRYMYIAYKYTQKYTYGAWTQDHTKMVSILTQLLEAVENCKCNHTPFYD